MRDTDVEDITTSETTPPNRSKNRGKIAAWAAAAVLLLSAGVAVPAIADSDDDAASDGPVSVTLSQKNGSGISGSAQYGNTVTGTATGMDPSKDYYSFVYGAGSDATGNNPCILTGETLAGPINTVGKWDVDSDGNGTLSADAPVSPDQAGTLSIREDDIGTGGLAGPLPVNALVACGQVGPDQDTTLGRVQDQLPQLPNVGNPLSNPTKVIPSSLPSIPALSGGSTSSSGSSSSSSNDDSSSSSSDNDSSSSSSDSDG